MNATTYLKKGDKLTNFDLLNFDGKRKSLQDYLAKGKLVLSFYRGDWCPYCNLEVKGLQDNLGAIQAKGANLVAISPQMPDYGILFKEKHKLNFDVLSDLGNGYARKNGLEVALSEADLQMLKEKTSFEEKSYQKVGDKILVPVPATYVIDEQGTVVYSFVDIDYTKRAPIQDILNAL